MSRALIKKKRYDGGLWFIIPGLLGFALFFIAPFLVSLCYTFLDKPVNGSFIGLKNFIELFANKSYLLGLANTLRFISLSVPLNLALSLLAAMLIHRKSGAKQWLTLVFLIPLVIPSGSMASFWRALFSQDGALNAALHANGLHTIKWLDSSLAMLVIVVIFLWKNLGYNMVLFLSGLSSIPKEHYEAAWVDGANPLQSFRHVTLPGLAPTFILAAMLSIINSFKVFKEIYLLTGSYPHESIYTLQHFMNNMFSSLNYPKLTTATTILVVMIALFTQGLLRLERRVAP